MHEQKTTKFFNYLLIGITLLIVLSCSLLVGCKNKIEKEEIAYKMICYVADEYNEDTTNITLQSGRLTEQEDGNYFATLKVVVRSNTMYFAGTYYVDTGEIEYKDMTKTINSSIVGAGPGYLDTESFDIAKVNKKLSSN